MSTDPDTPCVPLARLLPRTDAVAREAADAFWRVVADRFPEIHAGDMDPLTAARMDTTFRDLVDSWLTANNAWRPAVGQRVVFVRDVERFTEYSDFDDLDSSPFVTVPAGRTGVVTVYADDEIRVRLDEPLPGAEVLDHTIVWATPGEFGDTLDDFPRDIDAIDPEPADGGPACSS